MLASVVKNFYRMPFIKLILHGKLISVHFNCSLINCTRLTRNLNLNLKYTPVICFIKMMYIGVKNRFKIMISTYTLISYFSEYLSETPA